MTVELLELARVASELERELTERLAITRNADVAKLAQHAADLRKQIQPEAKWLYQSCWLQANRYGFQGGSQTHPRGWRPNPHEMPPRVVVDPATRKFVTVPVRPHRDLRSV